jgi:hypothetical protein
LKEKRLKSFHGRTASVKFDYRLADDVIFGTGSDYHATRTWNLFGTFYGLKILAAHSRRGKWPDFQLVVWWAHQGSNLGPAD